MEHCGAMDVIRTWLTNISDNRVAQLMIIGWAFVFLIEGAGGFGTPPAGQSILKNYFENGGVAGGPL